MATPPTDYQQRPPQPKPAPTATKTLWIPLAAAFLVPTIYVVWLGGGMSNRLDALAQDVEDNGVALSTTPSTFIPRPELDAKLENIRLEVKHTNDKVQSLDERVKELSKQGERQTAAIIRSIEASQ